MTKTVYIVPNSSVHGWLYDMARLPVGKTASGCSQLLCGDRGSVSVEQAGALRPDGRSVFVRSLHQIGSPLVDLRTFRLPDGVDARPFELAYGPGTSRPILRTSDFSGLGIQIQRDDPQITANYSRIGSSDPSPWLRPGFPALARFQDWLVGGRRIRGVLASSVDRPGGFVVLEPSDLARAMGYAEVLHPSCPAFSEADLDGLIPYECLCRLLDWAESVLSGPGQRHHQTEGTGPEPKGKGTVSMDRAPAQ